MREAAFIKENKDEWEKIDEQSSSRGVATDELADNFVKVTDDLSYARTFYPGSQTVKYLNQLAARYFLNIVKYRKKDKGRFVRFWVEELPLIMYRQRRFMLYSLLALVAGMLLGVFSMQQNGDFANLIMGDRYMEITKENIAKGDPMAIYKSEAEAPMFVGIASNNIRVAFYAFMAGIFVAIGAIYILFSNGVMLGVFQYFFYEQGLLKTSLLSIWLHGTLEISAIVIAGGAGIALGCSLLFPGTYSRINSIKLVAKDAVKIVIGLVPVFLVAAFIESFITRLTDMPVFINITIIALSALFVLWYYCYYPYKIHRKFK